MTTGVSTAIAPPAIPDFLLEASAYTDPALLTTELYRIFRRTWLYVGDRQDLMQSQTVRVLDVAGTSILLTQTQDGQLYAFHNVCPHRAAQFCAEPGLYHLKHLVCPYHAWTYDLKGKLVGTPQTEQFNATFCREDYPLVPIRLEQWAGFVFVCLDEATPPLLEVLGSVPTLMAKYSTPDTQKLISKRYAVACNWKVYHDNTLCDYHVAIAHRTTLNLVQGPVRFYEYAFDRYVNLLYTPTTSDWRSQNLVLESLDDYQRNGFLTFGIFPNLHLLALPNGVLAWLRIDPVTVNQCEVVLELFGIPGISPAVEVLVEEFESFMQEDMAIAETVQKGYASGVYRRGPVNGLEARIVHQQALIQEYLKA